MTKEIQLLLSIAWSEHDDCDHSFWWHELGTDTAHGMTQISKTDKTSFIAA